ncbi:uncharacterized protein SAPINGB_P002121 [Magnusiomyces paraingens]|uniref:Uncharacterized protein n=1 Tax=Magnusiomyces paraingens TaxID=2606893 RepID=A0A5E8BHY1_9ASCO|nr:uncharacterized protein SAPINGB_P002121 [Saprochaete ingens]VVT49135.1 unnamed protein product [Saprochaete ingens]
MLLITCSFSLSNKKALKKSSKKLKEAEDFGTEQLSIPQFSAKSLRTMFTSDLYLVPTTPAVDPKGKRVSFDFKLDVKLLEEAPLVNNVYASKALSRMWGNTSLEHLCQLVSTVKKCVNKVTSSPPKCVLLVNGKDFKLFKFEKASFTISHESEVVYGCLVTSDFCKGRFQSLGKIVVNSIYKVKKCGKGMMQDFSRTPQLEQNISDNPNSYNDYDLISKSQPISIFSNKRVSQSSTIILEYNSEEDVDSLNNAISLVKQEFFNPQVKGKKNAENIYVKSVNSSMTTVSSEIPFSIVLPTPPPKVATCTWN